MGSAYSPPAPDDRLATAIDELTLARSHTDLDANQRAQLADELDTLEALHDDLTG
jgi:hypothetical protein